MKTFYNESKEHIDSKLAEDLVGEVNEILNQNDKCNIAVAGGRSIATVLDALATKDVDWSRVNVFAVDDRCLPLEDPESNSRLIKDHLADKVAVNFHPFTYSPESADQGAGEYTKELNEYGGKFDVLLLSAGEDGHTAGLFPGNSSFNSEEEGYVFFSDSPKPPNERVSATRKTLAKAQAAFIMFIGEAKQEAYDNFLDEGVPLHECPSKLVQSLPKSFVYTDCTTS